MKKVLIVIYDMRIGGAQKSLLSFLQAFAQDERYSEYQIDLMPFNPTGEFLSQIPDGVNIRKPENVLRWMGTHFNRRLIAESFSLRAFCAEMIWVICSRLGLLSGYRNVQQKLWQIWRSFVPSLDGAYDIAVSYIDGMANYYVMEKVNAKKKVLWVHNDYRKIGYDAQYDMPYYDGCDAVMTISEECKEAICSQLPKIRKKTHIVENISLSSVIQKKAQEGKCPEYSGRNCLKLLTVGRLHEQKGIDIAIKAARILKERGVSFIWLVVGEGRERTRLEEMIAANDLGTCFLLIGSRENPYAYMNACDILVQPSRYEGKSIVLDEAKILNRLIVATDYSTVHDAIVHGETGFIA